MKPKGRRAKIAAVWAQIPSIECKGLCWPACGPIGMSAYEFDLVEKALGEAPSNGPDRLCSALVDEKCSVYSVRPTLCRLYGVAEGLPCDFGCRPDRMLSRTEAQSLMLQAQAIGGEHRWTTPVDDLLAPPLNEGTFGR